MKNMRILPFLMLLASTQIQSSGANAELLLGLAYQAVEKLNFEVLVGNDDMGAKILLSRMNKSLQFDADQQQALNNAKNGYIYKGAALDPAKIQADAQNLQNDIDNNNNISNKNRIEDRKRERNKAQEQLNKNMAVLKANANAAGPDKTAQAQIKVLREKNALVFEQALETYLALYGQSYGKGSMWGASTIIASKYDQNLPITAREYNELVATLQQASSAFVGLEPVMIDLGNDNKTYANISQVLGYINNLKPAATRSWATFGLNVGIGAAIAAGALVAVAAGSNAYQGKNWNDTSDAQNLYNAGSAKASDAYNAAVVKTSNAYNAATAENAKAAYNASSEAVSNAYNASAEAVSNAYNASAEAASNAYNASSAKVQGLLQNWNSMSSTEQKNAAQALSMKEQQQLTQSLDNFSTHAKVANEFAKYQQNAADARVASTPSNDGSGFNNALNRAADSSIASTPSASSNTNFYNPEENAGYDDYFAY